MTVTTVISSEGLRISDDRGGSRTEAYRRFPLDACDLRTSEIVIDAVWRIVHASGGRSRNHQFRVDYTDDLVRARIRIGEGDRSIVVEAPRSRQSLTPVSFVHPGAEMLTDTMRSGIRLPIAEPLDAWLDDAFAKERLPIVLAPFRPRGLVPSAVRFGLLEVEAGVVREAASVENHLQFGPGKGCEVEAERVLCAGGASDVVGEESRPSPW